MTKEIALTKGFVTQVDDDMFDYLSQWRWIAHRGKCEIVYAIRTEVTREHLEQQIHMHRVIIGAQPMQEVDHINRKSLDNQRANLRICTRKENSRNRKVPCNNHSGYLGVSWCRRDHRWRATIKCDGVFYSLGYFHSPEDAARAYNKAAMWYFGEFANLNEV
mgnify:CR=1 FL=1